MYSVHSRVSTRVMRGAAGGLARWDCRLSLQPMRVRSESQASSHREAPLIAGDPRADNTDVYAFVTPDEPDTVTLIANWIPFEEPNGGPNFYPFADDARYNINIDNDGDALADLTYTWVFDTVSATRTAVPLQHRSGHLARRRRSERLPDLRPDGHGRRRRGRRRARRRRRRRPPTATRSLRRRSSAGVDAGLRAAARAGHVRHRRRRQSPTPARPTTRSSSTCACSTCSTAATPRRSGGHPRRLQREHDRPAGAEDALAVNGDAAATR